MVGHQLGETRDLVQQAESSGLKCTVDAHAGIEVQHAGDRVEVEEVFVVECGQRPHHVDQLDVVGRLVVVLRHQPPVFLDATDELLELEHHQPAVGAELDHVALDLVGDPPHHLGTLEHGRDIPHGDEVFHLQRGERSAHRVEPRLVPGEDLQRLVGARQDARDGFEGVLLAAPVDGDQRHVLRHGEHRYVELPTDPFRGAVAGAGLRRRDVGIGHEMHVGARHP